MAPNGPRAAKWELTGNGKIDGGAGPVLHKSSIIFTSPDTTPSVSPATNPPSYKEDKSTITATCDDDQSVATITITTIRPNAVSYELRSYIASNGQPLELGIKARVYVLPADVNFEKITISEGACAAAMTGFFTKFTGIPSYDNHTPGTPVGMSGHAEGKGTILANEDNISMNTSHPPQVPPTAYHGYSDGTFKWDIPQSYQLNGSQGEFAKALFVASITVDTTTHSATLKLNKNGFLSQVGEDSPPSPPPP